jgi:hypothetical protein
VGCFYEEDLSTEQRETQENAWFPGADGNARGTPGAEKKAREGAQKANRFGAAKTTSQLRSVSRVRGS